MSSNSKVLVGNLSFKTTKQDLTNEFAPIGGLVNAYIISRGNRSMGYGFVEFETDAAAQKAISDKHHTQIDGREINVELVKPREGGSERGRGRGRGGRGGFRGESRGGFRGESRGGFRGESRGGFRGESRGGFRGVPRGRGLGGPSARGRGGEGAPRARATRGFGGRGRGGERRQAQPEGPRELSTTTLYVNNLPFKLEDDDLKQIFKEYNVVSAHVVANKYNGRKKGYGFVELANQEEQTKALELNNHEVEGRKIGVRVACKETKKEASQEKPEKTEKVEKSEKTEKTEKKEKPKTEKPKEKADKTEKPKTEKPKEKPKAEKKEGGKKEGSETK